MQHDDARKEAISCNLCGDPYQTEEPRTPCILPCFHTFCRQCLEGWSRQGAAGGDDGFSCPTCRQACPTSAAALQINFALMAVVEAEQVSRDETVLHCQDCDDPASSYCQDCDALFCEDCSKAHRKNKRFSGHALVSVADFKARKQALPKQKRMCTKHRDQAVCLSVVCCLGCGPFFRLALSTQNSMLAAR
jgi:tripartite motif-containing protein 56